MPAADPTEGLGACEGKNFDPGNATITQHLRTCIERSPRGEDVVDQ
jgi:hypothetical protein